MGVVLQFGSALERERRKTVVAYLREHSSDHELLAMVRMLGKAAATFSFYHTGAQLNLTKEDLPLIQAEFDNRGLTR